MDDEIDNYLEYITFDGLSDQITDTDLQRERDDQAYKKMNGGLLGTCEDPWPGT